MQKLLITIILGISFGVFSSLAPIGNLNIIPAVSLVAISLISFWAVRKNYQFLGILMILTLGISAIWFEAYGIASCYPYGCFAYSDAMGYKLSDLVPWTVFFGWTPFVLLARAMSKLFIQWRRVTQLLLSIFLLVTMDLVLDPGAVHMGLWRFLGSSVYYGVPLSNFFGWLLTWTIGLTIIFYWFDKKHTPDQLWSMMWSGIILLSFWTWYNMGVLQYWPLLIWLAMSVSFIQLKSQE